MTMIHLIYSIFLFINGACITTTIISIINELNLYIKKKPHIILFYIGFILTGISTIFICHEFKSDNYTHIIVFLCGCIIGIIFSIIRMNKVVAKIIVKGHIDEVNCIFAFRFGIDLLILAMVLFIPILIYLAL